MTFIGYQQQAWISPSLAAPGFAGQQHTSFFPIHASQLSGQSVHGNDGSQHAITSLEDSLGNLLLASSAAVPAPGVDGLRGFHPRHSVPSKTEVPPSLPGFNGQIAPTITSSSHRTSSAHHRPSTNTVPQIRMPDMGATAVPAPTYNPYFTSALLQLSTEEQLEAEPLKLQHLRFPNDDDGHIDFPGINKNAMCSSAINDMESKGVSGWIPPSGPRLQGQGVENVEQGIARVEKTSTGQVIVKITLLAAGFVIGPSGKTIREIGKRSGAEIKSWTAQSGGASFSRRPLRVFLIDSSNDACRKVLEIMSDAVDYYKFLCEGKCAGKVVPKIHKIRGIEFSYQPPPRNIVPFAASLVCSGGRPLNSSAAIAQYQTSGALSSHHNKTRHQKLHGVQQPPSYINQHVGGKHHASPQDGVAWSRETAEYHNPITVSSAPYQHERSASQWQSFQASGLMGIAAPGQDAYCNTTTGYNQPVEYPGAINREFVDGFGARVCSVPAERVSSPRASHFHPLNQASDRCNDLMRCKGYNHLQYLPAVRQQLPQIVPDCTESQASSPGANLSSLIQCLDSEQCPPIITSMLLQKLERSSSTGGSSISTGTHDGAHSAAPSSYTTASPLRPTSSNASSLGTDDSFSASERSLAALLSPELSRS